MIKALRKRPRPDNLVNQVRAGGKSTARQVYLASISAALVFIAFQFFGPILFLDSDGMVTRDTRVIATDFVGRIERVHVNPGDTVTAGTVVATVQSTDVTDRLADMTGKIAAFDARQSQIEGRLRTLNILMPGATERVAKARVARARIADLANRQLVTTVRQAEMAREFFEAEKELSTIASELETLKHELVGLRRSKDELGRLRASIQQAYDNGNVTTNTTGTVGARILAAGVVTKRGDAIAEIYHGPSYVRAYVPRGRLYDIAVGDRVVISDGISRRWGSIERLEGVSEQLPQEFQSSLKSVERQQLMRIRLLDGNAPFAIPSTVKVMGRFSPSAVIALAKGTIVTASGPREAATMMLAGLGLTDDQMAGSIDVNAVGSLGRAQRQASAFELAPDDGPPDWRALHDRSPAKYWRSRD